MRPSTLRRPRQCQRWIASSMLSVATMESPTLAIAPDGARAPGSIVAVGSNVDGPMTERIDGHGTVVVRACTACTCTSMAPRMLALCVAHGVTSCATCGRPRTDALRERVAKGDLRADDQDRRPFVVRPRAVGSTTWSRHRRCRPRDRRQAAAGYDFVKVYNGLSLEAYDAVLAAARAHGLRDGRPRAVRGAAGARARIGAGLRSSTSLATPRRSSAATRRCATPSAARRRSSSAGSYADPVQALRCRGRHRALGHLERADARHGGESTTSCGAARRRRSMHLDTVSPDWRARWDPQHLAHAPRDGGQGGGDEGRRLLAQGELAVVKELVAAGGTRAAPTRRCPSSCPGLAAPGLALFALPSLSSYAALHTATMTVRRLPHDSRGGSDTGARAASRPVDADRRSPTSTRSTHLRRDVRGDAGSDRLKAVHAELVDRTRPHRAQPSIHAELAPRRTRCQYVVSDTAAGRLPARRARRRRRRAEADAAGRDDHRVHGRALSLEVERPERHDARRHLAAARSAVTPARPRCRRRPLDVTDRPRRGRAATRIPEGPAQAAPCDRTARQHDRRTARHRLRLSIDACRSPPAHATPGRSHAFRISSTTRRSIRYAAVRRRASLLERDQLLARRHARARPGRHDAARLERLLVGGEAAAGVVRVHHREAGARLALREHVLDPRPARRGRADLDLAAEAGRVRPRRRRASRASTTSMPANVVPSSGVLRLATNGARP